MFSKLAEWCGGCALKFFCQSCLPNLSRFSGFLTLLLLSYQVYFHVVQFPIPTPFTFDICDDHSRNAQCPEELPPEGVPDEAVDGEVGRGVEHHERVRDVGHHLAPVRRQVRPVRLVRGAPGAGEEERNALSMLCIGQTQGFSGQMIWKIQGCTIRAFPGSVKLGERVAFCLPNADKRT